MAKKEKAVETVAAKKATLKDFEVIVRPLITEKSMTLSQEQNKFTFEVQKDANKTTIKNAIERIYNVTVTGVQVTNVKPKLVTRGTRHQGKLSGYKKAVVTLAEGNVIDLFKE